MANRASKRWVTGCPSRQPSVPGLTHIGSANNHFERYDDNRRTKPLIVGKDLAALDGSYHTLGIESSAMSSRQFLGRPE